MSFLLRFLLVGLGGLVMPLVGCQALLTGLVMLKGTDTPPEFPIFLKEKISAVVVCRVPSPTYQSETIPPKLIDRVTDLLDENIKNKRFSIVAASDVEAWLNRHDDKNWLMVEVGKSGATKADVVVGIELQDFRLRDPQSPHLFQGTAQVLVTATRVETGKIIARKNLRLVDPPDVPVPASSVTETVFRAAFTEVVAREIAALFHPYDPHKLRRIQADSLEMY